MHFTILRPPEKLDGTPPHELSLIAFPTADLFGRKINEFDLIIFDRYSNQTILPSVYFDNILRYVENGGAFLVATGPDFATVQGLYYSPLESIIPARPDGSLYERAFRAHVTKDGEKHPVTRGLEGAKSDPPAWGEWFRQVDAEVVKGNSMLTGANDKPLLVLSREGKGRVAALLTDQMWLWARGYRRRRPACRSDAPPRPLADEGARSRGGGAARQRPWPRHNDRAPEPEGGRRAGDDDDALRRDSADRARRPPSPGSRARIMRRRRWGSIASQSGELKALVNVGPENPREFREVVSTTEKLRPLAEATGGTVRRLSRDASGAITLPRIVEMREASVFGGADYIGVKRTGASALKGVEIAPLALGLLGPRGAARRDRAGLGVGGAAVESFRFRLNRNDSKSPRSVVFSSREPVPTSLENTLARSIYPRAGAGLRRARRLSPPATALPSRRASTPSGSFPVPPARAR